MALSLDTGVTFGQWLKRRRRQLGHTQDALAEKIGYTSATLQKLEQDARRPSPTVAALLADALGLSPDERAAFFLLAQRPSTDEPDRPAEAEARAWRRPSPPAPSVELIGRSSERASLAELLGAAGQGRGRLVTLVGPGGIGKTTLALQVAADLGPAFPDGVAFAPLAPLSAAAAVPYAIGAALGLPPEGPDEPGQRLLAALRGRELLLVLDNCEQLLAPSGDGALAALVARLLAGAPGLVVLATSRERLRLRDEQVFPLAGLDLPAADSGPRVERSAAVRLFLERARQVSPALALDGEARSAVARLCRRLEGMPLAIELAATWTRAMTPVEIAAEIDHALDFLATDARDASARHRSLRAALGHSWDLLDPAEARALARLAVFHGGCDREAAAAVVGATLPLLTALVDKSLVRPVALGGSTRYTLHELVRQYAAEELAGDDAELRATERRHTAYYAELLRRSIGSRTGETAPEGWPGLMRDFDNVRAAWLRAAAAGDAVTVTGMASGLMTLYDYQGRLLDGAAVFEAAAEALRASAGPDDAAYGLCRGVHGYLLYRVGQLQDARRLLREGIAVAERSGRDELSARLLTYLGNVDLALGALPEAQTQFARSAELAARAGDEHTYLWAVYFQGSVALYGGDGAAAEALFTSCGEAWREHGYGRGLSSALLGRAELARFHGELETAEQLTREALHITSLSHDAPALARCVRELGALALARGQLAEARYLLTESCESLRGLNDRWAYRRSLFLMAQLEIDSGEHAAAWRVCAELLTTTRHGDTLRLAEVAFCSARILAAQDRAAEALGVLVALGDAPGEASTLQAVRALRADLERRLGPAELAAVTVAAAGEAIQPLLEGLCAREATALQRAAPPLQRAAPPPQRAAPPPRPPNNLYIVETGETLSPRELDVLRLIVGGASNQAIADTLIISLYTAKHHVASILRKLGVATRTQAALRGRALAILPPDARAE